MNAGATILCFSSTDWDGIWGSRQQVMLRFARRGWQVLFVEQPAGLEHLARYPELRRRKLRRWREGLKPAGENLWLASLPPLLPGRYYSARLNRLNQRLTIRWTRRYLSSLGLRPELLWLYNPEQGALVGAFGERLSVYHCIDEFTAGTSGRKRRMIAAEENDLLERVDLVFANSPPTYENKLRLNPYTYRVPSGVDSQLFSHALDPELPEHPVLADLPRPRAGYTGQLNDRLDYGLLEYLAVQRPGWSFIFAGDTYPWAREAAPLRRLRSLSNCRLIGNLSYSELPALLKGLDVCLLPYVEDERAYFRSPLKLYEYLAAGRPVVATRHPEAAEQADWVFLSDSPQAFLEDLERARCDDSPERQRQRQAAAAAHDWDRRVDTMERVIREALAG